MQPNKGLIMSISRESHGKKSRRVLLLIYLWRIWSSCLSLLGWWKNERQRPW